MLDRANSFREDLPLHFLTLAREDLLATEQELAHDLLHHSWISVSYLAGKANQMRALVEQWEDTLNLGPAGCRHAD